jgi:hypothetical protein
MHNGSTFQRRAGNFGVNWTVKFVEAPIDRVSDCYAAFLNREISRGVPVEVAAAPEAPPEGAVVQVAGSEWVILFHHWRRFAEFPVLSGIGTRVLEFGGDDSQRAHTCNLFTPSKPVMRYRVASVQEEEDEYCHESGIPKSRRPKTIVVSSYDHAFDELGIVPIFVSLSREGHILVKDEDRPRIVRADLAAAGQAAPLGN